MRTLALVAAAALVFGGTALGAEPGPDLKMLYELELGGDNGSVAWEDYEQPLYGPGNPADHDQGGLVIDYNAQGFDPNTDLIINWDAVVKVDGATNYIPGPPEWADWLSGGAANTVFSLALTDSGAVLQEGAVFFSTINDGDDDGLRGMIDGTDPLEMAAFCRSFNYNNAGPPNGVGRAYDPAAAGGPEMSRVQYPTIGAHGGGRIASGTYTAGGAPVGGLSNAELKGMGCGYPQFNPSPNPAQGHKAGVGIDFPAYSAACYMGLGHLPVFEGQINVAALDNGVYTLTLEPGTGNNVIRADFNCEGGLPTAFAMALPPEDVLGDTITFEIKGKPGAGANATAWRSVNYHGDRAVSDYLSVALDPSKVGPNDATSEPRAIGITLIEVDFDGQPGTHTPGQVILQGGLAQNGADSLVDNGDGTFTLVIPVTGSVNKTCYWIDISNSVTVLNDANCYVATCNGDGNNNRQTDALDRGAVKVAELAGRIATWDPRLDVNLDGVIDALDRGAVKVRELALDKVVCP